LTRKHEFGTGRRSRKDHKIPHILRSEVEKAIKEMRDKKATGNEDVPVEALKCWEMLVVSTY
jgi:hypothetical protein